MSRASSLHRLQVIDLELDRTRSRLAEIDAALGESAQLMRARASLEEAAAALREAQSVSRDAEYAASAHRTKIAEAEKVLYGGSIRNPKELQDLQNEMQALTRYLSTLEDRLLEAMVEVEEREHVHAAAMEELARAEEGHAALRAALAQEQGQLNSKIERLEAEREVALASIAQKDLALYDELRESMGETAVALLQDGSCNACGLTLSASARQAVLSGSALERCKQCGRVLYGG